MASGGHVMKELTAPRDAAPGRKSRESNEFKIRLLIHVRGAWMYIKRFKLTC